MERKVPLDKIEMENTTSNSKNNLPKNWVWTRLDEITKIILGQSPPSSTYNQKGEGLPFYQGKAEFGDLYPKPQKWCSRPKKIAEKGDVLISVRAPVGPTNIALSQCCIGRGLAAIRPLDGIDHLYIFYYLRSIERKLLQMGTGSTFKAISGSDLKSISFPIAPFNEQKLIVAEIEKQFSRIDEAVAALKRIKANLKRYKASVLKAAVEGKLTEEWRKNNPDVEPASELLKRILPERRRKWEEANPKKKYKDPAAPYTSNLPELPEGWIWTSTDQITWYITSGSRNWKKFYSNKGAFFIRTQDINKNRLELENVAFVDLPDKAEGKRSLVEVNDILVIITGANVGKVALVEREIAETYVSQSVGLMKLPVKSIAKYLHIAMIAEEFGKTQLDNMVYGMGRPVLNLNNLREIKIPLPPQEEQNQIVSEIERHLTVTYEIERALKANLKRAERLRQSFLKKAFSGRFVVNKIN